ncbi:MAG: ABC transporter substrate-binding protein [Opitutales bacterium]|nr:ABC transporter substrate-binding protein [Opitutales bacterium]
MTRKFRIGVFISPSINFPQAEPNLCAGFRAGIGGCAGTDIDVLFYETQSGAKKLGMAISRAYVVDRLDMSVVNTAYAVLENLCKTLALYRKPLFVVSSGADIVRKEELHPYVFRNSLHYWQCAYEAGRWAGKNWGGRVMLVTSMFDCCFDSHAAFIEGVKAAGAEAFPHICDAPDYIFHAEPLIEAIKLEKPDGLAIYACGNIAAQILETIASDAFAASIPALHGPMLHEAPLVSCLGEALSNGKSVFSSSDTLLNNGTEACREFRHRWAAQSEAEPDCFALLGYETGLFIRKALEKCGEGKVSADVLKAALEGLEIDSPRGRIAMDCEYHATCGPVYLRELGLENGSMSEKCQPICVTAKDGEAESQALFAGHINRWQTDYLQQ